ncbi:MAG: HAD family hydrolase [Thermodesulfobacteriota bacterium]|nr:HAD family hydrolase [Thermodesulfobacteriota bacterium]
MTIKSPITTVLFDLDGTLLNVDMYRFIPAYLKRLAESIDPAIDQQQFIDTMIERTMELLGSDDGSQTNEAFFLSVVQQDFHLAPEQFLSGIRRFCREHLTELQPLVNPFPLARQLMQRCQEQGLEVVIATNPVFPRPVVDARLEWAGIGDFDYQLVTSIENSRFCKPNPKYFSDILDKIGVLAGHCLMVGNDTEHDLSASTLGITTFLVDTWLIDRGSRFVADYRGSHLDLFRFLGQLV